MATAIFTNTDCQASTIKISELLQFYVRFTNIGIGGSQGSVVPPIGIAIIGVNNYIL